MSVRVLTELLPGISNVQPISDGFQNKVFEAELAGRKIIIRLSDKTRRPFVQLKAEVELLNHLASHGCRVANTIQPISEMVIDGTPYYAVLFEHTNGRTVDVLNWNEWNEDFFFRWGKMIGRLHQAHAPKLSRPIWLEDNELNQNVKVVPWLHEAFEEVIRVMNSFQRDESCFGLIHNDLHTGNFHLSGQDIILFDFDDCAYHFYAQDLAVSIYHAIWTGTSYHPEWTDFPEVFLSAFLKGYRSIRLLTPNMYEQLLQCLKMREIFLFTLFKEKWDPNKLEDWQHLKLIELEESIRNGTVPYKNELSTQRGIFSAG